MNSTNSQVASATQVDPGALSSILGQYFYNNHRFFDEDPVVPLTLKNLTMIEAEIKRLLLATIPPSAKLVLLTPFQWERFFIQLRAGGCQGDILALKVYICLQLSDKYHGGARESYFGIFEPEVEKFLRWGMEMFVGGGLFCRNWGDAVLDLAGVKWAYPARGGRVPVMVARLDGRVGFEVSNGGDNGVAAADGSMEINKRMRKMGIEH